MHSVTLMWSLNALWALALSAGCTVAPAANDPDAIPSFGEGKFDTGFYSNRATELDGEYRGTLRVPSDLDDAAIAALVLEQVKFAKTTLYAAGLHPNLVATGVELGERSTNDDGTIDVSFRARGEVLVTHQSLALTGFREASELIGLTSTIEVPADPTRLMTRVDRACATYDPDSRLDDATYFASYAPNKEGCAEAIARTTLSYEITFMPQRVPSYPELDRLAADREVTVVALFGAGYSATSSFDPGVIEARQFVDSLIGSGFTARGSVDWFRGTRYERDRAGLHEVVDVIPPEDLYESFEDEAHLIRSHEIVVYNGHARAGTKRGLASSETFSSEYQILALFSCWGYDYYAKQALEAKGAASPDDPWALIDVVAGTEIGLFGDHSAKPFVLGMIDAVERHASGGDVVPYSWSSFLDMLNSLASEQNNGRRQVFGVGGVTTNRYWPIGLERQRNW